LREIRFATALVSLRLQFARGLSTDDHPDDLTSEAGAEEHVVNHLLVWRIALQFPVAASLRTRSWECRCGTGTGRSRPAPSISRAIARRGG